LQLQTNAGEESVGEYKSTEDQAFYLAGITSPSEIFLYIHTGIDMLFEYCTEICIENPLVTTGGNDPKAVEYSFVI
jgi:hypothetical protein